MVTVHLKAVDRCSVCVKFSFYQLFSSRQCYSFTGLPSFVLHSSGHYFGKHTCIILWFNSLQPIFFACLRVLGPAFEVKHQPTIDQADSEFVFIL